MGNIYLGNRDFLKFFFCLDGDYIGWLDASTAALANEGLEQIQADSYIGIEIRRAWVELYRLSIMVAMQKLAPSSRGEADQKRATTGEFSESTASFVRCTVELYLSIFTDTQRQRRHSIHLVFIQIVSFVCAYKMVQLSMGVASISQHFYNCGMKSWS